MYIYMLLETVYTLIKGINYSERIIYAENLIFMRTRFMYYPGCLIKG